MDPLFIEDDKEDDDDEVEFFKLDVNFDCGFEEVLFIEPFAVEFEAEAEELEELKNKLPSCELKDPDLDLE